MFTETEIRDIAKQAYYDTRVFDLDCREHVGLLQRRELFDWPGWNEAADAQSEYIATVNLIIDGEGMPSAAGRHGLFVANRIACGWKRGAVVNRPEKIHPWLVAFSELPEEMRMWLMERDRIFESSTHNQIRKRLVYTEEGERDG